MNILKWKPSQECGERISRSNPLGDFIKSRTSRRRCKTLVLVVAAILRRKLCVGRGEKCHSSKAYASLGNSSPVILVTPRCAPGDGALLLKIATLL